MTDWVVLVESANDISQAETPHKVLKVSDYITRPALFAGRRPYILNLCRSYGYQSEGYYASLLAEARGFMQFRQNVLAAHRAGRSVSVDERSDKTADHRRTLGHFA